ncbi:nitrile hydratase accessory protein [Microbacterium oleivorans]|uniref:Nitrile hydratase accessory protein n=1 Tax=Microbacterium oleivorans TaxID=273677 RepID=A0A7D5J0J2_9MICO|nr:nitrile hydratase accessory protein [Microbacterium oleivorans]QLD12775.1 nitrile hydratase accessory protein [Microbacterium oleivorans]
MTLTEDELDTLRSEAPGATLRPGGEESFRAPWELRSFAIGIASFEQGRFAWPEFQGALIDAIDSAESAGVAEEYYARWVEAYENLVLDRVGIDASELDARTRNVLETPRDATHQHAHHDPVAHDHAHRDHHHHH